MLGKLDEWSIIWVTLEQAKINNSTTTTTPTITH